MPTITASNGYSLRPLQESDRDFMLEVLKDFPIGSNTYYQRINEFSNMLYVTEGFTVSKVKARTPTEVTMITEKDSTKLSFCHLVFDDLIVETRMGAVHPSHRGQKHYTAQLMLAGYLAYIHCGCTGSIQEATNTDTLNALADTWRPDLSTAETQRDTEDKFGDGQTYTLNKITATAAEHETHRASHSTWGSVTYTVS